VLQTLTCRAVPRYAHLTGRSPDPLAGLRISFWQGVPGQVLIASLRVWLRRALIKSTVVGFPKRDNQISVCGHAAGPALGSVQSSTSAAMSGSRRPQRDSAALPRETIVPDKVTGPLGPRRNIAAALRQLREDSGKNLTEVAEDLMISTSKLSRLENAQGRPQPRDIRDLVRYYEIEDNPLGVNLRKWASAAQRKGWWTDFDDEVFEGVLGGFGLDEHISYESDATVERIYTLPFLPGLLQTDEYATAIFREMEDRSEEEIVQLLEVRARRKRALSSRAGMDPLKLVAVTHESALCQAVGPHEIMRDQLDALIEESKAPNVSLHVLPFEAKPVFTMTCMYAYFEYGGGDMEQDAVHIETHAGYWSIEDPDKVAKYRVAHDALVNASLSEDDSRALIRAARDGTRSVP
jgi:transcriptional regulator with XRE-family HTH domain